MGYSFTLLTLIYGIFVILLNGGMKSTKTNIHANTNTHSPELSGEVKLSSVSPVDKLYRFNRNVFFTPFL